MDFRHSKRKLLVALGLGVLALEGAPASFAAEPKMQSAKSHTGMSYGTDIVPSAQIKESRLLAKQMAALRTSGWRVKGDQRRSYPMAEAGKDMPYRIYVPSTWDGKSKLPMAMFLHGAWNDESSYLDSNDGQMLHLAEKHGYLLVSPLGYDKLGTFGACLRPPATFMESLPANQAYSALTDEQKKQFTLSEKDVINVLELALREYPVDRSRMFLFGHSMGSSGVWYLGAKYSGYWAGLAGMSGPFVVYGSYPWERIRTKGLFVSEGTKAQGLIEGSRRMRDYMTEHGMKFKYKEVESDHGGMVPLILPDVFDFFDSCSSMRKGK